MIEKAAAIFAALMLLSAPASGQSLKDLRAREAADAQLAREAAFTSRVCRRTVPARIDWASARTWPSERGLVSACDGALSAVEALCRNGRRNVVRSFTCAGDGSGPRLSAADLRYGAFPGADGYAETKEYLDAVR